MTHLPCPASPGHRSLPRCLWGRPFARVGLVLLAVYAVVAVAAPILAPCPPEQTRRCGEDPYRVPRAGYGTDPRPPGPEYLLGTTARQFDLAYGLVWGTRTAFKLLLLINIPALLIGILVGALAGLAGGWSDRLLMGVVEVFKGVPSYMAAFALVVLLQVNSIPYDGQLMTALVLTALGWMGCAQVMRSEMRRVRDHDYILAARAQGQGPVGTFFRHVLPNTVIPVFATAVTDIGPVVLYLTALSFFGLGVPDGYADWGQLLSHAFDTIHSQSTQWHVYTFPGLAISLFVMAWSLVGAALCDVAAPRWVRGGVY